MSRNHRGWWLLQKTTVQNWHSTCVNNVFLDVIAETKKKHILQRIITVINWIWGYPIFGQSHIDALTALTTITVLAQNSSQRRLSI
jgi:hypothetical protein